MTFEGSWFDDVNSGKTHAVKMKSPNELGIYDMSGNIYEWCSGYNICPSVKKESI